MDVNDTNFVGKVIIDLISELTSEFYFENGKTPNVVLMSQASYESFVRYIEHKNYFINNKDIRSEMKFMNMDIIIASNKEGYFLDVCLASEETKTKTKIKTNKND